MEIKGLLAVCALIALGVATAGAETSPYAGMQIRGIKALSPQQVDDLREGRGMGMALAAELNSYPGPAHVLELATALGLSPEARERTQALFAAMKQEAIPLGQELVAKEAALEQGFATGRIDDRGLRRSLGDIARLQGELRYTHLKYHLATRALLTSDQVASYDKLRGYAGEPGPAHGAAGHQHKP